MIASIPTDAVTLQSISLLLDEPLIPTVQLTIDIVTLGFRRT